MTQKELVQASLASVHHPDTYPKRPKPGTKT